jgi:hypothetical protein
VPYAKIALVAMMCRGFFTWAGGGARPYVALPCPPVVTVQGEVNHQPETVVTVQGEVQGEVEEQAFHRVCRRLSNQKRFLLSFDLGYFKFHKAVYFKFHKEPATP